MRATLVTFDIDRSDWDDDRRQAVLESSVAEARDASGLRSKTLLHGEGMLGGFYVFQSPEDADGFFDDAWTNELTERMGVAPQLRHFEVPAHVDNVTGSVDGPAAAMLRSS